MGKFYNELKYIKILFLLLILAIIFIMLVLFNRINHKSGTDMSELSAKFKELAEKDGADKHTLDLKENNKVVITLNREEIDDELCDDIYIIAEMINGSRQGYTTLKKESDSKQLPQYKVFAVKKDSSRIQIQLDAGSYQIFCIAMNDVSSKLRNIEISEVMVDYMLDMDSSSDGDSFLLPCE